MAKEVILSKQVCDTIGVKFYAGTHKELNLLDNETEPAIFLVYDYWKCDWSIPGQPHTASGAEKAVYEIMFISSEQFSHIPEETEAEREKVMDRTWQTMKKFLKRLWQKEDVLDLSAINVQKHYRVTDSNRIGVWGKIRIEIMEDFSC